MLAKINGLFRLTRDAELIMSQSGTAILKLGLACSEKRGDNESQLFLDATAFGKPAEIINQYAGTKGTQMFLSGKLQTESWQDKQGNNRSKTTMIIEAFEFVGGKKEAQHNTAPQPQQYQNTQAQGMQQYVPPQQPQVVHENVPQDVHPNQQSFDVDDNSIPF